MITIGFPWSFHFNIYQNTMKKIFLYLTLLASTYSFTSSAHALWIETAFVGKVGQAQEVKIFYGEYAENEKDSIKNWYSDVSTFTLWAIDAKNNKTQLTTKQGVDQFSASFTPSADGVYTLLIQHPVKDFGNTRYEFGASATVAVGKATTQAQNNNTLSVQLPFTTIAKVGKPVTLNAAFNGKSSTEVSFDVVSPTGWAKKFKADANGNLTFEPLWPGIYFIEAMHTEKTAGELSGKAYKATWRGSTYRIEVTK